MCLVPWRFYVCVSRVRLGLFWCCVHPLYMLIQYIHTFDTIFWVYEKKLYLVLRPDTYKVA